VKERPCYAHISSPALLPDLHTWHQHGWYKNIGEILWRYCKVIMARQRHPRLLCLNSAFAVRCLRLCGIWQSSLSLAGRQLLVLCNAPCTLLRVAGAGGAIC
jgi:hypothetical protein